MVDESDTQGICKIVKKQSKENSNLPQDQWYLYVELDLHFQHHEDINAPLECLHSTSCPALMRTMGPVSKKQDHLKIHSLSQ